MSSLTILYVSYCITQECCSYFKSKWSHKINQSINRSVKLPGWAVRVRLCVSLCVSLDTTGYSSDFGAWVSWVCALRPSRRGLDQPVKINQAKEEEVDLRVRSAAHNKTSLRYSRGHVHAYSGRFQRSDL